MEHVTRELAKTGNLVGLRLYRLSLKEASQQGPKILLYAVLKRLLSLGSYGHCSIVIPGVQEEVEYTVTDNGLVHYSSYDGELYTNDTLWLEHDACLSLHFICEWERITGAPPVTPLSIAEALARPNCYSSYGCCSLFVCYALSLPPTTLVDDICLILLSDMSLAQIVAVETTSESGEMSEVERRSTVSRVGKVRRRIGLWLVKKFLGLYRVIATLLSIGGNSPNKPVSSTMLLEQDK